MPFGLKSAPATFMRFVHEVLYSTTPELKNHTEVYLDNILIYTNDDLYNYRNTVQIILQNKVQSFSHESLYNYAAEIVCHNVLLAGKVFYHEVVSLQ